MQTIATVIPNEAFKYSPFQFGINAASSWCLGYQAQAEYLRIDFVNLRLVTGVAVAGSSDYAGWVTKFDVKYGLVGNNMRDLGKVRNITFVKSCFRLVRQMKTIGKRERHLIIWS